MEMLKFINYMNALVITCLFNWIACGTVYLFIADFGFTTTNVLISYILWMLYTFFVFVFYFLLTVAANFPTNKCLLCVIAVLPAGLIVCAFNCLLLGRSIEPDVYIIGIFSISIPKIVAMLEKWLI